MGRHLIWIFLGAFSCALARDVVYKPPTTGALATIRLSAPDYVGGNLLSSASLSMLVQRVEKVGRHCNPETLGWIDYRSEQKTYAIAADKIGSFGVRHQRKTLANQNDGSAVFAFIPQQDHLYDIRIHISDDKLAVKIYDETAGHAEVPVEMHYLMICARQNAAEIAAEKQKQ